MRKITITIIAFLGLSSLVSIHTYASLSPDGPSLKSEAAIVIEANSGEIIFEKNSDKKLYPASLTKIATAIYAIEKGNLEDVVTVSRNARDAEGTTVFLEEGEEVPLIRLIQGLLINSGNDAGISIGEHLGGNVEQFMVNLNTYLKSEVGVQNTNFVNPHGLFDAQHTTTAEDLAKITQYATKNKVFREIFGTKTLDWEGETWDTTLITHHKILKEEIPYSDVTGGKNGYVNQSGFTLATTAQRDDLSLIVVTLNSNNEDDEYKDTISLLDYGFDNYKTEFIEKGSTFNLNNEKYTNSDTIAYTTLKVDKIKKQVEKGGILNIVSQNGEVLSTYKLNKNSPGKLINSSELKNSSNTEEVKVSINQEKISLFVMIIITITLLIGGIRKYRF